MHSAQCACGQWLGERRKERHTAFEIAVLVGLGEVLTHDKGVVVKVTAGDQSAVGARRTAVEVPGAQIQSHGGGDEGGGEESDLVEIHDGMVGVWFFAI